MKDTKRMIKTFGVILGIIVILFIVLLIFMSIFSSKVNNTQLVNVVENAAKQYYSKNSIELPSIDLSTKISTDKLVSENYMKPFEKITKNKNCSGEVSVYNNGGEYLYVPSLKCNEFKTSTLSEVLEEKVVTSGAGLYKDDNNYYFKGEFVDNYIKIGDTVYRIVSIENGNIKLINTTLEKKSFAWDNRYNIERKADGYGINDYAKSRLKESISEIYRTMDKKIKKYVVKADWCVGKRSETDKSLSTNECSEKISDYLGTITPIEYMRISLDENCININGSCKNYNYLNSAIDKAIWTFITSSNNTYNVFYINSGVLDVKRASSNSKIAISFNISGDSMYVSGDGTSSNPYIIR